MKIIFIQDHKSGIKKDTVREVNKSFGDRMIKSKFAKETDEEVTPSPAKEKGSPAYALATRIDKVRKPGAGKDQKEKGKATKKGDVDVVALKADFEAKKDQITEDEVAEYEAIIEAGKDQKELKRIKKLLDLIEIEE